MDDYISREAAFRCCTLGRTTLGLISELRRIPAADVKPVVHGKWQLLEGGAGRCPNCKSVLKDVWDYDRSDPFCRECGADMREGSAVQEQLNHEGTTRNGKGKTK